MVRASRLAARQDFLSSTGSVRIAGVLCEFDQFSSTLSDLYGISLVDHTVATTFPHSTATLDDGRDGYSIGTGRQGATPSGPSDLAKSSPAEYELVPFLHLSRRRPRSCKKCLGRLSLYREWTKVLHMHMIHIVCLTCITFFPECQELSWRQEEGLKSTTV